MKISNDLKIAYEEVKRTKRFWLITLMIVVTITLVGCEKGEQIEPTEQIVTGTWICETGNYTYTFNEDGTGYYEAYENKIDFTYQAEEGKISIMYSGSTSSYEATYIIKNGILSIKDLNGKENNCKRK